MHFVEWRYSEENSYYLPIERIINKRHEKAKFRFKFSNRTHDEKKQQTNI